MQLCLAPGTPYKDLCKNAWDPLKNETMGLAKAAAAGSGSTGSSSSGSASKQSARNIQNDQLQECLLICLAALPVVIQLRMALSRFCDGRRPAANGTSIANDVLFDCAPRTCHHCACLPSGLPANMPGIRKRTLSIPEGPFNHGDPCKDAWYPPATIKKLTTTRW